MRKILKYVFSLVMLLALTGCVKYKMNMEVKADKSVDLSIIYAMDSSIMDQFGGTEENQTQEESNATINKEEYNFLLEKGFKVEDYLEESEDKKYAGIKISKTYKSIDDITKEEDKEISINKVLGEEETFDESQFFSKNGNVYKANLLFDFDTDNSEDNIGMDMSSFTASFVLKYTVKLPVKPITNNATEVSEDGKTLTWDLKYGQKNNVIYTFELSKASGLNPNTLIYIGIATVLTIVVIVVISIISKKKNNDSNVNNYKDETNTPENNSNQSFNQNMQTFEPQPMQNAGPIETGHVSPVENINQSIYPNQNETVNTIPNNLPEQNNINVNNENQNVLPDQSDNNQNNM